MRKTVKKKDSQELLTAPAPPAVIEKSFADVSFLVGMLVDKFLYHIRKRSKGFQEFCLAMATMHMRTTLKANRYVIE